MKKNFRSFLVRLLAYTIFLYACYLLIQKNIPERFHYNQAWLILLFFFLVTAVFHFGVLRNAEKGGRSIISYFMQATVLKFFLYLVVMIVYSLLFPAKVTPFISNFFVIYMLITVFEVSNVYAYFKRLRS